MNNVRDTVFIKAFGENLRKLRKEKQLSQEELSYKADIPINQIGRIERGEVNTTISTISVIARALEVHQMELLRFEVD